MRSSLNNTQQKASWQQLANMNLDDLEGGDWEYGEGTHDEWGFKLEAKAAVDFREKLRKKMKLKGRKAQSRAGVAAVVLLSFLAVCALVDGFSTTSTKMPAVRIGGSSGSSSSQTSAHTSDVRSDILQQKDSERQDALILEEEELDMMSTRRLVEEVQLGMPIRSRRPTLMSTRNHLRPSMWRKGTKKLAFS